MSAGHKTGPPSGDKQVSINGGKDQDYGTMGKAKIARADFQPGEFIRKYTEKVVQLKYVIIVFWLLCLIAGVWKGFALIGRTNLEFKPPSGSDAAVAQDKLNEYFPSQTDLTEITLLLERTDKSPAIQDDTKQFTEALVAELEACQWLADGKSMVQSYLMFDLPQWQSQFVQDNLVLTVVEYNNPSHNAINSTMQDFISSWKKNSTRLAKKYFTKDNMEIKFTGIPVFAADIKTGTEHDLLFMDGIAFPIALVVLAYVLRSARLLILPILNIGVSIVTSFLLVLGISYHMPIISFAPSLMMSSTIALSIDYSLFLLSRFREELLAGRNVDESLVYMLWSAGHTITVSGCTLAVCFFGLLLFPVSALQSPGLATGLAIFITLIVNLTLTPALLTTFQGFFKKCVHPLKCAGKSYCRGDAGMDFDNTPGARDALLGDGLKLTESSHVTFERLRKTMWYKLGLVIRKAPAVVVLVIIGLFIPCAMRAMHFNRTSSVVSFSPRTSEATKALELMSSTFGAGRIFPYDLIMTPQDPKGNPVLSDKFFKDANDIIAALQAKFPKQASYTGVMHSGTLNVTWSELQLVLVPGCPATHRQPYDQTACELATAGFERYVSNKNTSTFVEVRLATDPFSQQGSTWLDAARKEIESLGAKKKITMQWAKGASANADSVTKVYELFPMSIGVTTSFVIVLVGFAFRSILIPLRAVFSIGLTLGFVFGTAVFIYQDGIFDKLHFDGLKGIGALVWATPVMSFSVLVGLGLDYDIFLLSRVVEYRRKGQTDDNSILYGLAQTGGIITAAGIIMAVAFVGLLFSAEPVLNQLSYFLVFAVLIDTLVIRTMLVPACMFLLGRFNWWPGRVPAANPSAVASNGSVNDNEEEFFGDV